MLRIMKHIKIESILIIISIIRSAISSVHILLYPCQTLNKKKILKSDEFSNEF